MSLEQDIHNKVKDAYRRGIKEGQLLGLKKAILLSNNIEPYITLLKRQIDQEIMQIESKD